MSRKDTIIVAALVNAALLVVLFIGALKTKGPEEFVEVAQVPVTTIAPPRLKQEAPAAVEEKVEYLAIEPDKPAQQPTEPAPETALAVPEKVVVARGDTLERIARRHGTTVEELMRENHLKSTQLQINQELILPPKRVAVPKPAAPSSEEPTYYIVKNGDNLWKIAIEHHLKVEELLKLNGLDEKRAKRLKPGDKLRIR